MRAVLCGIVGGGEIAAAVATGIGAGRTGGDDVSVDVAELAGCKAAACCFLSLATPFTDFSGVAVFEAARFRGTFFPGARVAALTFADCLAAVLACRVFFAAGRAAFFLEAFIAIFFAITSPNSRYHDQPNRSCWSSAVVAGAYRRTTRGGFTIEACTAMRRRRERWPCPDCLRERSVACAQKSALPQCGQPDSRTGLL